MMSASLGNGLGESQRSFLGNSFLRIFGAEKPTSTIKRPFAFK